MHSTDPAHTAVLNSLSTSAAPDSTSKLVCVRSYVDSGAARSVCPLDFANQFKLSATEASRNGSGFRTATGKTVTNRGCRTVQGKTAENEPTSMSYAVADIAVALDSVSQICDTGAEVVFTKQGGHIKSISGKTFPFERAGDTYVRSVWISNSSPFPGPRV